MDEFVLASWRWKLDQGTIFTSDFVNTVISLVPGRFGLIKAVDLHRTNAKRKTEFEGPLNSADSITKRPVKADSFNFTLIKASEFISISNDHAIIVNPIVLPQILTESTILAALEFHSSFERSDFRMCFNSLGGWASVNHHHWHGLFLSEPAFTVSPTGQFPIETCPSRPIHSALDCSVALVTGHVNCLRFSRSADDRKTVTEVFKLVHVLLTRDIPHNVMVSREFVYLTPRQPQKVCSLPYSEANGGFHPAVAEVSGYMICFDKATYQRMNECDVFEAFQQQVSLSVECLTHLVKTTYLQNETSEQPSVASIQSQD